MDRSGGGPTMNDDASSSVAKSKQWPRRAGPLPAGRPLPSAHCMRSIQVTTGRQRQGSREGRAGRRLAPSSDPIARWRCGAYACARKQCKYVETQERRPAVGLSLVDRPAVVAVLSSRVHGRRPRIV
jgi:hypothetical protein